MSILNSFSNSMTSSTISRLSAPRSSMKLASSVILSRSTPSSFSMMSRTFLALSAIWLGSCRVKNAGKLAKVQMHCLHHHAAVHHEHLSRDVRSMVRREKRNHRRNVLRLPEAIQRDQPRQGSACLRRPRIAHVGSD